MVFEAIPYPGDKSIPDTAGEVVDDDAPKEKQPWRITDGELDPVVKDYINLADLDEPGDEDLPDNPLRRALAHRAVSYAVVMTAPERMMDPEENAEINNALLQVAIYCSFYSDLQHASLREMTEGPSLPAMQVIEELGEQGLHRDARVLAESMIRMIYLKHTGRRSEISPAITESGQQRGIPRI